jgi:hypothetical protein
MGRKLRKERLAGEEKRREEETVTERGGDRGRKEKWKDRR